jgi:hypothetical protein
MAKELRIIRGDTYDIVFTIRDKSNVLVPITGIWSIIFESDYINKNSIDNPSDFIIETNGYGTGSGVIHINSTETDPDTCKRLHFKIKLYQNFVPPVIKTVASGDLFFINEAW